jgi:Gas vesicle synthesis protein GvpL/GvpF
VSDEGPPPGAAWYVYGVVPAGASPGRTGVASRPVGVLAEGDVAALVSVVPVEEFAEEQLRANLNDRPWLERTAREHEDVLDRALADTAVVPFRLCTIYESPERVRELLARRGAALTELLRRLEGRVELGVKAYFDAAGSGAEAEPQSGREYLLRRQREREAAEEAGRFKAETARTSHERLAAVAEEARANPPQPPELSGRADEMLLNGAYLVRREDGRLREAVAELESLYGPRGVTYELTGPWPPYNFVPRDLVET